MKSNQGIMIHDEGVMTLEGGGGSIGIIEGFV